MTGDRKIIIIAGPNGAGKTTFARQYLPKESGCPLFVNADLIAEGLSPFLPESAAVRAGRLMVTEIDRLAGNGDNFAFETTLAGLGYASKIQRWREAGYRVKLIFLSLATPEEAIERVALRVAQGGHNVPEDVIRRRFHKGRRNFEDDYRNCASWWQLVNNSGKLPVLVEEGENTLNEKPVKEQTKRASASDDPDMQGVMPALLRAVRRAHKVAHQTGTDVVIMQDGKVVHIPPDPALYNDV